MRTRDKHKPMKWHSTILCILLIPVLVSGTGILLTDNAEGTLWMKMHKLTGTLFYIFLLIHIIHHFKWYKLWFTGKIKQHKRNKYTILCSVFLLLFIIIFFLKPVLISYYEIIHGIVGLFGCILIIFHFMDKRTKFKVS